MRLGVTESKGFMFNKVPDYKLIWNSRCTLNRKYTYV